MKPTLSIDSIAPRRKGIVEAGAARSTASTPSVSASVPVAVSSANDLEESLASLDVVLSEQPSKRSAPRRHFWFRRKNNKHPLTRKKMVLRGVGVILLLVLLVGGFFAYRAVSAVSKITHGNVLSLLQPDTPLKTDDQGRTNILVFGTSQDDSAHQNADGGGGLWLADSVMLLSINQKANTVKMVSIPRDLWVTMPNGCSVGYQAKINAVYECGADLMNSDGTEGQKADYASKDTAGASSLESTIQTVTGITPQYYAHVDYSVLKQAVDALGGIQVDIEGDGVDGIYDTNFDWDCPKGPYTCKNVYYPHNGTYTLDGTQALFLARARGDAGAYSYKDFGLARGDYDRQANQQKILQAIKTKATSTGTLMNVVAVTNLLNALGNNITTNLQGGEMKTIIDAMKKVGSTGMQSVSLVQDGKTVVTSQMIDGQSAQIATSGVLNYTSIISYLAQQFSANPAVAEGASIVILNGSGVAGVASTLQTQLAADGLNVTGTGNATSQSAVGHYTIYDLSSGKMPQTIAYLKAQLSGATVATGTAPAEVTVTNANVVVVIGPSSTGSN